MIRPSADDENEKTEEVVAKSTGEERHSFQSATEDYRPAEFNYATSDIWTSESSANIKIAEPREFEDAETITEAIKLGKIVIMYLDEVQPEDAQRILDFIAGYCHSRGIKPQEMKPDAQYLINPQN